MTVTTLSNRQILLGVTGGIAAYKSPDLVRRLRDRGARVRVVMTAAAERFVTAQTFQAVSGEPVRTGLWDEQAEAAMGHIELARWADAIVIAPASADFIARLAGGLADDLLTTLCLASAAPVWVAPAMNAQMWMNPATQANVALLRRRGVDMVGPDDGDQACGEVGTGRMTEPEAIADTLACGLGIDRARLANRHVVITAGPTRERIDPVRYITNYSSGKMGFALARAASAAGARVTLIAGPVSLATPANVGRIDVESAAQMHRAVHEVVPDADVFIATAAVADHRPAATAAHKLKKTGSTVSLSLEQTPDILASVAALAKRPYCVGFAAETRDIDRYAREKLAAKNLDMIVANEVGDECGRMLGFGTDDNEVYVLWRDGQRHLPRASKLIVAQQLIGLIAVQLEQRPSADHGRNASA